MMAFLRFRQLTQYPSIQMCNMIYNGNQSCVTVAEQTNLSTYDLSNLTTIEFPNSSLKFLSLVVTQQFYVDIIDR